MVFKIESSSFAYVGCGCVFVVELELLFCSEPFPGCVTVVEFVVVFVDDVVLQGCQ